ncbi:MAG: autotransporter adhesin family protein [Propionibacteriaceae bacterium]|jgi:predicted outer membrane repeat protein|nr:autotransporter adhesin family protein [Propionibacteriaceae bacterium]
MKRQGHVRASIAAVLGPLLTLGLTVFGLAGIDAEAHAPNARANETTVYDEDELANALLNLVPRNRTPFTIIIGADFPITSGRAQVSSGQNVTITSDDLPHVLTRDALYGGNLLLLGEHNATGPTNATLTITNLVLDGNEYTDKTTASIIANHYGTLNLGEGAVVRNNLMTVPGAPGSGVVVDGGTLNMYEDALIGSNSNLDSNGGGLYCYNHCTANVYGNAEIAGNTVNSDGGGVLLDRSTLNIFDNAKIRSNHALRGFAGGIDNNGGTLNIYDDAEVSDNHAETVAAGIYTANGGKTNIYGNARVQDNAAVVSAAGLQLTGETSELSICGSAAISGNHSSGDAAGIGILAGTATVRDSAEVSYNAADTSGGGIANLGGTLSITDDAKIWDNYSGEDGAGLYLLAPTSLSGNVTIHENTAGHNGGGIAVGGSTRLAISGTTLTDNNANNDGGAMHIGESADLHAVNTVFQDNEAGTDGGAIFATGNAFKTLTTDGVTFADNSAGEGSEWELNGDEVSVQHERNIINTSYTTPFTNAYNNYDINYSRPSTPPDKPDKTEPPAGPSTPPPGPSTPPPGVPSPTSSSPSTAPTTAPSSTSAPSTHPSSPATPSVPASGDGRSTGSSGARLPNTGESAGAPQHSDVSLRSLVAACLSLLIWARRSAHKTKRPARHLA